MAAFRKCSLTLTTDAEETLWFECPDCKMMTAFSMAQVREAGGMVIGGTNVYAVVFGHLHLGRGSREEDRADLSFIRA